MSASKPYILVAAVLVIAGVIYLLNAYSVKRGGSGETVLVTPRVPALINEEKKETVSGNYLSAEEKAKRYELAKEITTPDGFINTGGNPVTLGGFIGKKVILVDFWTYSCINCQRTTPYLNAWYEKYKDKGLVIVGMHTPEFEFEKDYNNVQAAVEKFGIKFPVVLDNDYSTWVAYKNQYWPRKYLIDIDGYMIYDHIGEGAYEETEAKIQGALEERMAVLGESGTIAESLTKEIPVEGGARSPETYFGASRNRLGNGVSGAAGDQKGLQLPAGLKAHTLYLVGDWNIQSEFAQNSSADVGVFYHYTGKDVFFVAEANDEIVVEVLRDGKPLGSEAGADIIKTTDGKTVMKIKEARLYKIIQDNQSGTHTLEFIILKPGLKAFTFTFG